MASYWIKLYTEVLDDPKVATLPDRLWRRFFELCLVAGKAGKDGELPEPEQVAWMLRIGRDELLTDISRLAELGLVQVEGGTSCTVTNYSKRQAAIPAHDRYAEFRKRNPQYVPPGLQQETNAPQTERLESRKESESESESDSSAAGGARDEKVGQWDVYRAYEQEIGPLTPLIADELGDLGNNYSREWIQAALREAVTAGARNLKYVQAILSRWKGEGFRTPRIKAAQEVPKGGGRARAMDNSDLDRLIQAGV